MGLWQRLKLSPGGTLRGWIGQSWSTGPHCCPLASVCCVFHNSQFENRFSKELWAAGLPAGARSCSSLGGSWCPCRRRVAGLASLGLAPPAWPHCSCERQAWEERVNQKWSGTAPGQAASLQNRAAFVQRQVISRNTADTRPRAA